MTFILSKILWLLLRPSTLILLAGWVGLALAWLGRRRIGMALISLCLVTLAAITALPIDQWLVGPLEDRFPAVTTPPAQVDGVIVLGGAMDIDLTEARGMVSLNETAERMTSFATLARRYPTALMAFTGGNGRLLPGAMSEAEAARRLFGDLGLADRGIVYEDRSRNTYENALFLRDIVHPKPGAVWVLITSASHMPRSVGIFRKLSWPVLPWPVGYKTGRKQFGGLGDAIGRRLEQIDWGVHEWVGMAAYRLMGRTDALFPGP